MAAVLGKPQGTRPGADKCFNVSVPANKLLTNFVIFPETLEYRGVIIKKERKEKFNATAHHCSFGKNGVVVDSRDSDFCFHCVFATDLRNHLLLILKS